MIVLRNLTKQYATAEGTVTALDGVSLAVRDGEFVALMGVSGSGKTTLLHILACLEQATSGSYRLDTEEIGHLPPDRLAYVRGQKFGIVFSGDNLVPRLTALQQVEVPLVYLRAQDRAARAQAALELVGLGAFGRRRPGELSVEQQQRVTIARALVGNPSVLLAEEPTGTLDGGASAGLLALLSTINRERGVTIIIDTCKPEVAAYATRMLTLHAGRLVGDAPISTMPAPTSAARAFPLLEPPLTPDATRSLGTFLQSVPGVLHAYVSPATALVYVDFLPAAVGAEQLAEMLCQAGYVPATPAEWFDWRHSQRA